MLDNDVPGVPVVNASGYLVGFVDGGQLLASTLPSSVRVARNLPGINEGTDSWVRYDRAAADWPVEELTYAIVDNRKQSCILAIVN
jgi:hypothetical protein